jgi:HD domain
MMSGTEKFGIVWAKIGAKSPATCTFHPLICHMLDIAEVARALWRDVLSGAARGAVARGLALSENDAGTWVSFLAALHDVGKASPIFQLHPSLSAELRLIVAERLESVGLPLGRRCSFSTPDRCEPASATGP